jgi:hypothetical protein
LDDFAAKTALFVIARNASAEHGDHAVLARELEALATAL